MSPGVTKDIFFQCFEKANSTLDNHIISGAMIASRIAAVFMKVPL